MYPYYAPLNYLSNLAADSQSTSPNSQAVAVFIPVAAAAITGVFAFVSVRTHPTVRIKNLIEISKDIPDSIHAKYATQRLILREIARLDISTAGWYVRSLTYYFLMTMLAGFVIIRSKNLTVSIAANVATVAIGAITLMYGHRKAREHWKKYEPRLNAIEKMADREIDEARAVTQKPPPNSVTKEAPKAD
ncbi:hypothetical protein [Mycobacteroides abscessus]|uniref:hypothetical protein n=1 Tax=Mycobacteroides abscessus TaxID=36809 RepID=UPI000C25AAB3|nr:hypothetical protein [Mycobacteroides abscessus]